MLTSLHGTVAIVTGAGTGIGAATASELARRGVKVMLAGRQAENLEKQANAIKAAGEMAAFVATDISDPAQVTRLVEATHAELGGIDILMNIAGVGWYKPFSETSFEEMTQVVQTNLLGTMYMTRAVLPEMLQRRRGAVISISSVAGAVAIKPVYSASKYGVRGFSLSMHRQLRGSGVSFSLVSPGSIRTAMVEHLNERMPGPEDIARVIADLPIHPKREVVYPFQRNAEVWMEKIFPGVNEMLYTWRHRRDLKPWQASPERREAWRGPVLGG